jgi:peptidoglycan/xylan/chitin deacetylase (PgdA/CDA1 family)
MDLSARFFRLLFPTAIFEMTGPDVHLTFDDGPHPQATPAVLETLRRFDIRATFFVTGTRVREFAGTAKMIAADGHSIGNHAFHHKNMIFQSTKEIVENITHGNEAVADTTGLTPTLFRPPFGYYDYRILRIARSLGMRLVHWSHDTRDFKGNVGLASVHRIADRVKSGSILLLHDNDATSSVIRSLLPQLVEALKARGFTFAAL